MIALIASAILGLYVLLPVVIFDKTLSFFVPVKNISRSRTEELAFGAIVVLIPLIAALWLSHCSWYIGHHPFPIDESRDFSAGTDYKTAILALQSDRYFESHAGVVWNAVEHIGRRQARFVVWVYTLLFTECGLAIFLTRMYGRWRKFRLYRIVSALLVNRVSPWHILFSTFSFDPKTPRSVHVDVLSSGQLFTGVLTADHYLVDKDGSLNGLVLVNTCRYRRAQLDEDRKQNVLRAKESYWTAIAGEGQFYIPANSISNINIRYVVPDAELKIEITEAIQKNKEIAAALTEGGLSDIEVSFNKPLGDIFASEDEPEPGSEL